jgi:hypothetical protein
LPTAERYPLTIYASIFLTLKFLEVSPNLINFLRVFP